MRARTITHLLALLAILLSSGLWLLHPSNAAADSDPASDILLGTPAYFPYQPAVTAALQSQLERALAQLRRKGLNLKVAIIASPIDLGAIPNMFRKPQTYADFLEQEIAFNAPQPLLVVMPDGFGLVHAGPTSALGGLTVDTAHQSNGLARSAILAVQRIARANGTPISVGPLSPATARSGGGTSPLITFGGPAILVALAVAAAALFRRPAGALDEEAETREGGR
jgi:hypothetical protein